MTVRIWSLGLALLASACAGRTPAPPSPAAERTARAEFAAAVARAAGDERVLLAVSTAMWCKACKRFESVTLRSPEVRAWLARDGAVHLFDIDEAPGLAAELDAKATPMLILYQRGREIDRSTGDRGPEALLAWIDDARRGLTLLGSLAERVEAPGGAHDLDLREDYAQALMDARRYDEAADELAWLWEYIPMLDPDRLAARDTFLLDRMAQVAARYRRAERQFSALIGMTNAYRRRLERRIERHRDHSH